MTWPIATPASAAAGREKRTSASQAGHWFESLRRLALAVAASTFPSRCAGCGAWIDSGPAPTSGLLSNLLCRICRQRLRLIDSPLCRVCGRPFDQLSERDHCCGGCLDAPPPFDMARSAAVYTAPLDTLVQKLKYDGRLQTARPLGELLRAAFWRHWAERPVDLIVPVPLHRRRLRSRGFNQVQIMLRHWYRPGPEGILAPVAATIAPKVLVRQRHTPAQAGLDRRARIRNVRGAFEVADPEAVRNRCILLVDDVMTTGATIAACAQSLKRTGAARVDVLTLARAVKNV